MHILFTQLPSSTTQIVRQKDNGAERKGVGIWTDEYDRKIETGQKVLGYDGQIKFNLRL